MSLQGFLQSPRATIPEPSKSPPRRGGLRNFLAEVEPQPIAQAVSIPAEPSFLDRVLAKGQEDPLAMRERFVTTGDFEPVPNEAPVSDQPLFPLRKGLDIVLPPGQEPTGQGLGASATRMVVGAERGLANVGEQFTTPRNIATLVGLKGLAKLPKTAYKVINNVLRYGPAGVDIAFAGLAAEHAPEAWRDYQRLKADPNTSEHDLTEAAVTLAGTVGLGILGGVQGVRSAKQAYRAGKEARRLEEIQDIVETQRKRVQAELAQKAAAAEVERLKLASEPRRFIVSEEGKAAVTPESVAKASIEADKAQLKRIEELSLDNLAKKINPKAKGFDDLSPNEKRQAAKLRREAQPEIDRIREAIAARRSRVAAGREELAEAGRVAEEIAANELPLQAETEIIPPRETPLLGAGQQPRQIPPSAFPEAETRGFVPFEELPPGTPPAGQLPPPRRAFYGRPEGLEQGQVGPVVAEPPAPGFREFTGRPRPTEPELPVVPSTPVTDADRSALQPESAIARSSREMLDEINRSEVNREQRFVEIREQLAADYGKTFDQLSSGQKAAVTRKARVQVAAEIRGEAIPPAKPTPETPTVAPKQTEPEPVQHHQYEPTEKTATAQTFGQALKDFNKLSTELQGKPASEQMAIAKQRLEEKGYHPAIVDELTNPERLKRPELEGDVHDATTREGRLKRASEPPPELKTTVDAVADKDVKYRSAKADYDAALVEISKEVEKLGGEVIVNHDDGTLSIKMLPGKPKISAADQALINRLKQEAAEAGAYSLASVGKGFQVFAAPLKIKDGTPLAGDFRAKLAEFIRRKNALKTAKKEYDATNKRATDKLVDNYFGRRVKGEPTGSFVGRAGDQPVEVGVRRQASRTDPDVPVVEPTSGKTYGERIKAERSAALKRAEERGPQGEPYAKTSPIKEETGQKRAGEGKPFFDIRSHLDESERAALDSAWKKAAEAQKKANVDVYGSAALNPASWRAMAEVGYYVSKALGRATKGKAVEFGQWSAEMVKQFGDRVKPLLKDLWKELENGFRPGIEVQFADATKLDNFAYQTKPSASASEGRVYHGTNSAILSGLAERKGFSNEGIHNTTTNLDFALSYAKDKKLRSDDRVFVVESPARKGLINKEELLVHEFTKDGKFKATHTLKEPSSVIRENLTKDENAALDKAFEAANKKAAGQLHSFYGYMNPSILKDWATIAYYHTKGLSRAAGEKIPFDQWKEAIRKGAPADVFRAMEPHLRHLHATMGAGWKPGDPVPVPVTPRDEEDNKRQQVVEEKSRESRLFETTDLLGRFGKQNKVAGQIAEGFRQANDILENNRAAYTPEINKVAKDVGMRPGKRLANISGYAFDPGNLKLGADLTFKRFLDNPENIPWEALGKEETVLLKLYQKTKADIDGKIDVLLKNDKVRELTEQGDLFPEVVDFIRARKRGYQPTLNTTAREALFVDKGGPLYDAILDALLARNPKIKSRAEAARYLDNRQLYKFDDIPTHVYMGEQLVPISATDPVSATQALAYEGSRLIAFMKTFGTKYKENIRGLRKDYIDQFAKEGKSSQGKGQLFDELHDAYWGLRKRSAFSKRIESDQPFDANKWVNRWLVNPAIKGTFNVAVPTLHSLALSASALLQMPQHSLIVPNTGFKGLVRAYRDAARYAKTSAELEAMGGIEKDLLNYAITKEDLSKDLGRITSGTISRADFMQGISQMQDVLAASGYRNWARGLIDRMNAGKKLTTDQRQTLQNLKFTEAQVKLIEQGKLAEPKGAPQTAGENLFVDIIRRGRKSEQFTGLSGTERSRFQNATGLSRLLLPFQSYNIGMANRYRREMQVMQKAFKSRDPKQIGNALKRFGLLVGITEGLGEWSSFMRHAIRGHTQEDIEEDSAYAQLAKGEFKNAGINFLNNWAEAAFLGPLLRIGYNKSFFKEFQDSPLGAILNLAWGPKLVGDITALLARQGKYANITRAQAVHQFFQNTTSAYKHMPNGFRRALAINGLADVSDLDLASAASAYRDWADDNLPPENIPMQIGYREDKAASKRAYEEFKKAINLADRALKGGRDEQIIDILSQGFATKQDLIRQKGKIKGEGRIRREALKRLQSSMTARLFNVDSLTDEQQEALRAKIGDKRYEILEIHDTLLKELADSIRIRDLE